MLTPVLVLGRSDAPALLRYGSGYDDDGLAYDLIGRTEPFAPASPSGECAWYSIYLTTVHYDDDVVLRVTPRIDGVVFPATDIALAGIPGSDGEQTVHEIDMQQRHTSASGTSLRYAPRGVWLDVRIETLRSVGLGVGTRVLVEAIETEFEVVQEGKKAVTT